jgi:hypothetical protein
MRSACKQVRERLGCGHATGTGRENCALEANKHPRDPLCSLQNLRRRRTSEPCEFCVKFSRMCRSCGGMCVGALMLRFTYKWVRRIWLGSSCWVVPSHLRQRWWKREFPCATGKRKLREGLAPKLSQCTTIPWENGCEYATHACCFRVRQDSC